MNIQKWIFFILIVTVVSKRGNPGSVPKALAQIRIFLMRNYRLWDEKNNMVKLFQNIHDFLNYFSS